MTATDTYLLLRAFCDELARCGMRHACTSPGSRCTPIVLSLVREPRLRCWSHIDERCAGFFALGAAKASGLPVAVTCTSGTAAANLAPAVIEARHSRVPLIVLTADRPPELREVGAGQTIDQLKLYGDAVKWFFEVDLPDAASARLRFIRSLACRAYLTSLEGPAGPVHLNLPLREPLVLDEPLPDDHTGRGDALPYVLREPPTGPPATILPGPHPSGHLVIVAGAGTPDAPELAAFAARNRIPLLADPLSGARRGDASIVHYDHLLRDPDFTGAHRPDFVFRLGELPTSKPLRTWLASLADVPQIAVDPHLSWHDPDAVVGMRLRGRLPQPDGLEVPRGWLESWRDADGAAEAAIADVLGPGLSEPAVARGLGHWLGPETTLFVASSMPIRDIEALFPAAADGPRLLSNRGANGIDGTVSAAFGAAAVSAGPVVLLVGDVALAHDLGGLLANRRLGLSLTIVLLNNDGGGIFHFLPVSGQSDAFETHVATPPGLDFSIAASLYGCDYESPSTAAELACAINRGVSASTTTIIEVRTERAANLELHRHLAEAAISAIRE